MLAANKQGLLILLLGQALSAVSDRGGGTAHASFEDIFCVCRNIYESMLFLFVEHAFDVGDLLEVEAVSYRVKKIDLMYTVGGTHNSI